MKSGDCEVVTLRIDSGAVLSWPYLKANLMSFSRIQFDIISCVLLYLFLECFLNMI